MKEYDVMFVNVITPLHNGSGEGLGIVDNPIMRERITQFPIIQATSIKGVLREEYEERGHSEVIALFGPRPGNGEDHAGAVSFGEGQLLAFPVRSLKGCFVWVTSPLILWRFYQKINLIGKGSLFPKLKILMDKIHSGLNEAIMCPSGKNELLLRNNLLLEEFPIKCIDMPELEAFADEIGTKIFETGIDDFLKIELKKKLVILHDDTFRYFVTNATEITPNIRIGENGTTEDGSLRYTEFLPSETIMYSILTFDKSRIKNANSNAIVVKTKFHTIKLKSIQIGGDETTGKGVVKISYAGMM